MLNLHVTFDNDGFHSMLFEKIKINTHMILNLEKKKMPEFFH